MAKKLLHEICINAIPKRAPMFSVTIGNKKQQTVTLRVGADKLSVSCELSTRSTPGSSLSAWSTALARGIKAAMLLHILQYGRELRVRKLFWRLGEGPLTEFIPEKSGPFVYSLLRSPGPYRLSDDWKREEIVRTVLALSQKETDRRIAALYSYLMSKTERNQTERFRSLWTAMNGLYGFLTYELLHKEKKTCETEQIRLLHSLYSNASYFVTEKERNLVAKKLDILVFRYPGIARELQDPASAAASEASAIILEGCADARSKGAADPFWHFLLHQSYYDRCQLFHAERPVKLLSFAEESEIILLRTLGNLMEDYLDRNLHRWFDEAYIEKTIRPRAEDPETTPPIPFD